MSKYRARRTLVDGINFDSQAEARYYLYVKSEAAKGNIVEYKLQPVYELQGKFRKNGVTHQPITYKADFWLKWKDGREEVIDVKGVKTECYRVKKKLFEFRYPDLTIKEVSA